jgi:hypothetical protein
VRKKNYKEFLKINVHFVVKVPMSTRGSRTISICYEYAEKRFCSIDGHAAIRRLLVSEEIRSKSVMDG